MFKTTIVVDEFPEGFYIEGLKELVFEVTYKQSIGEECLYVINSKLISVVAENEYAASVDLYVPEIEAWLPQEVIELRLHEAYEKEMKYKQEYRGAIEYDFRD